MHMTGHLSGWTVGRRCRRARPRGSITTGARCPASMLGASWSVAWCTTARSLPSSSLSLLLAPWCGLAAWAPPRAAGAAGRWRASAILASSGILPSGLLRLSAPSISSTITKTGSRPPAPAKRSVCKASVCSSSGPGSSVVQCTAAGLCKYNRKPGALNACCGAGMAHSACVPR